MPTRKGASKELYHVQVAPPTYVNERFCHQSQLATLISRKYARLKW
jgi:hypothetical protein